ncbi:MULTISPECIES: nitroreductase family protein [Sphingobacterium]|uniref:nitroreductase family protein n=1 Tax=Sphingobacterium TaxID=28453 RepID=UPI0013DB36DE|nr:MULTISPECIES: nitroreductase family protein [unclassified Sphingobacterium]
MNLEEVLNYRRSVRVYDPEKAMDSERVKHCVQMATLAPNSSNMQLWEFYHVCSPELLQQLTHASLGQSAVGTASELVVFVTRQDLHRRRAKAVLAFEKGNIERNSPLDRQESRIRDRELYYGWLMPILYTRFFGIIGLFRKILVSTVGLFRPMVRQTSECDVRTVVHKTCALAAQTFMIAMANEGYDTCPLEGFDHRRVKKILKLPHGAEVNMIISCGIRKGNEGIWGERFRVPFNEVYHKV